MPVVATDAGLTTVAAWETLTGAPIEVAVRRGAGPWGRPDKIGERNARGPAAAVAPDGTALVAYQGYVGTTPAIRVTQWRDGGWQAPRSISSPGVGARQPQIAVDGAGQITAAWLQDGDGLNSTMTVATGDGRGNWTTPQSISSAARVSRPRLSVAVDGTAALVWQRDRPAEVWGSVRRDGIWSTPTRLGEAGVDGREAAVAVRGGGRADAVWVTDRTGSAEITTAQFTAGRWQGPVALDRGSDRAHEIARPGRADTGPAIVQLPDATVAAWSIFTPNRSRVRAAQRPDGQPWPAPIDLSAAGAPAGGVALAQMPGAVATAAWEEIDAGFLRARSEQIGGQGTCRDLAAATAETAGVQLAGGAAATAVFVDLNRNTIVAADIR